MTKWEYKLVKINVERMISGDMNTRKLQEDLNTLGREGWEVMNLFDLNAVYGKSSNVVVSLKRPLEGDRLENVSIEEENTVEIEELTLE